MDRAGSRLSNMTACGRVVMASVAVTICLVSALRAGSDVKNAPDVSFLTETGSAVHLGDLKGRIVLVDFWATWCPPCKVSFPALDALYREFRDQGLEVLAVNVDERPHDVDAFLDKHPHAMTVLLDPKGTTPPAFSVKGMPSSFLIDRAGRVRFTHIGYSTNIAEQYRREIALLLSEG